jgi:hypothetical protein
LGTITLAATTLQAPPKKSAPAAKQEVKAVQQVPLELTPTAYNWNYDPSATVGPVEEGGIAGPGCPCTDTENEPSCAIPDTVNGGCNSTPAVFSTIACGQSVCGATWANTTNRDTDWWNFTIAQPSTVTWVVRGSGFTPLIGFIATPCPQTAFITSTTGGSCTATVLTASLAAGTYTAFVASSAFVAIPCPSPYTATLTCNAATGACCLSSTNCQVLPQAACVNLGGTYQGDNSACPAPSSYNVATCSNTLEDISTTGTLSTVSGTDDNSQTGVPIGFSFNFYGNPFTTVTINNNGFLSFDSLANGFFTNAAIPTAGAPNNLVAPLWDDLDSRAQGTVHFQTLSSPSRFIVQWTNIQRFSMQPGSNTFQAILYATGDIEFRYGALEGSPPLTATTGVENSAGTAGTSVDSATLGTGSTCRHFTFVPGPACGVQCPADINGDHTVGVADLLTVISAWGPCPAPPAPCPADLNHDGTVGVADLLTVISSWGACP